MSRHLALLATLAVITVAACKASKPPAPKSDAPRSEDDGRLFVMARPEVTTRPMPARFTAALPATVAELASRDRLPPHAMLRAGIANGDAEVQRRLLRAIQTASTRGPVPDELREYYVGLFGYRASDAACTWLRATVPLVTAAVRDVLLRPLATCRDDDSGRALLDAGAPAALIVDWAFEPGAERPLPGDARIRAAMLEVARNGEPSDARKIGFVLARLGDVPAIFSATQALQRALPDPERRAWVAIGLLAHDSPAVRELGLEGCKHPVVAEDGMCDGSYGREPDEGGDPARRSLDEQLAYGFDADELAARFGPHEVAAALGRWATDPARAAHQRRSSLYDLATIDRAAAAKLAPLLLAHDDDDLRRLAAELVAFPDAAALERRLDALGFAALQPPAVSPQHPRVTAADELAHRGRQHWFDVETGQFPNEHDELLSELARLVAPALAGGVFEEIAPDDHDVPGPYLLRAYLGGKRYQVPAENLGDWYDVGAVLGLLNAVLADRGSDQRLLVLETGDQTAIVVAGPAAGLRALVDEGVLRPAGADESMNAGKAFEDKVFRQLEAEDQDVERDAPISQ